MKALSIELTTGEFSALLYALECAATEAMFAEDHKLEQQLRDIRRKVTKNTKEI